ncbi:MAG: iron-sulfur cluster assembly protein [Bacteroidota bacterium]
MITKQEVIDAISEVQHPAIDNSLLNLGIIKDIQLEANTAQVIFAFPFPNIPIAEQLVFSINEPIKALGLGFKYKIITMTNDEKEQFMQLEAEGWKGL